MATELDPPENGARLLVKLGADRERAASYSVALATPGGSWQAEAVVHEDDGRIDQGAWSPPEPLPEWLAQAAHTLLRAAWQRRRAGNAWPRRLSRWRPAPGEAERP